MFLNRWNYKTRKYDKVKIPDSYKCKTFTISLDEMITCPHCGDELRAGNGYVSLEYHSESGMGYLVCEDCYDIECERRIKLKGE